MNHAPLSIAHIPRYMNAPLVCYNYIIINLCDSLFYIAGLCYQWLKSDILSSDLLRSGELLLLKVGIKSANSSQYMQ